MARIGIYPGSFDPVHEGHLAFAREAQIICQLDTVVFLVEEKPRNKPQASPVEQRLEKLEAALAGTLFTVAKMSGNQFTTEQTLPEIKNLYGDSLLTLLIGSDVAQSLSSWSGLDKLLSTFEFAVGMRQGQSENSVRETLMGLGVRFKLINTPLSHLSSTTIRNQS